jgi:hypothetical protein
MTVQGSADAAVGQTGSAVEQRLAVIGGISAVVMSIVGLRMDCKDSMVMLPSVRTWDHHAANVGFGGAVVPAGAVVKVQQRPVHRTGSLRTSRPR